MSLRPMQTVAIDCDECDEVFIDTTPMTERQALRLAEQNGWVWVDDEEKDLCPECAARRGLTSKTHELALACPR